MKTANTLKFVQHHIECVCGHNLVYPMTTNISWSKLRKSNRYNRHSNHPKKQPDGTYLFFTYNFNGICPGHEIHYDESAE